jgi:transposase
VLAEDETLWRLFPILRCAWAPIGQRAVVPISGRNAKRALFGAINLESGHCLLMPSRNQRQEAVAAFLRQLRRAYQGRPIFLLLDEHPSHTALGCLVLAKRLNIELVWLPKQHPELNPVDHIWKDLKKDMAANYQYHDVDQGVRYALDWIRSLSRHQILRKAGLFSKNCWLRTM